MVTENFRIYIQPMTLWGTLGASFSNAVSETFELSKMIPQHWVQRNFRIDSLRGVPRRRYELWTCQTTKPSGPKPLVVNGVVVGPFEQEEEGTSVGSDVKVQGEDPATPGPLP